MASVVVGCWLTYYSVTTWKRSAVTWILMAMVAAYVGRKIWQRTASRLAKMRSQPAATDTWSAVPIETAETLGQLPQTKWFQATGSDSPGSNALFCLIGLGILTLAYFEAHKLLLLRAGTHAQGTVVQLEHGTGSKTRGFVYPIVQFINSEGATARFRRWALYSFSARLSRPWDS